LFFLFYNEKFNKLLLEAGLRICFNVFATLELFQLNADPEQGLFILLWCCFFSATLPSLFSEFFTILTCFTKNVV